MTAHAHDYLEYNSEIYSILDLNAIGQIGRPTLRKYDIKPQLIGSMGNPSGYSAKYQIIQNILQMTWLLIPGGVREYKTIGAASPIHQVATTDGENFNSIYENLQEKINISGNFSIGRELELYSHPDAAINYKKVLTLKFEGGKLDIVEDISDQIALLREQANQILEEFEQKMPESDHHLKYTVPEYQTLMSKAENLTRIRISYPSNRE